MTKSPLAKNWDLCGPAHIATYDPGVESPQMGIRSRLCRSPDMRQDDVDQIFLISWSWGRIKSQWIDYYPIPGLNGYLFKGPEGKNLRESWICLWLPHKFFRFLTRTHVTVQIFSWISLSKQRKDKKIRELYRLILAGPRAAQKRGKKWKKGQKGRK